MDPLSLTVSIITVVGLTSQISKALRSLYNLRHAPQEILELANEVSELQALLSLVQKATDNIAQDALSPGDLDFVERLIKSAQEPLEKLDKLIHACYSRSETSTSNSDRTTSNSRLNVSFGTWLKSKKSINKIRKRFLRAHRNINTALAALNNIHRQANYRLILNVHDLVLNQVQAIEDSISSTFSDTVQELERKFSRAVSYPVNEETPAEGFTVPNSPHRSDELEVTGSELSASTTSRTLTPQFPEKKFNTYCSNSDDPGRFDCYASIRASIGKGTCYWSCPCQCHPRKNMESPRWLTDLLGNLFYSYTGTPLLQLRQCNYTGCQQRKTVSCQLTYYFPQWMMKKMFTFTACFRDLGGLSGSWSIGFPRAISASHGVWRIIEQGQYKEFLQILRDGTIAVNDMADDDGTSLLLFALKFRSDNLVELLLDHGANPHLVDPRGVSACAYAQSSLLTNETSQKPPWSAKMDISLAEMSITDDLCFTPLHHVIIGLEKADLYQQLRLNSNCINTPDSLGRSPLHWAVIKGNMSAIEALLRHGASLNSMDKEQMSPLHDVCQAPESSQVGCARLLIGAGANVDARDSWGRTAFRIAVAYTSTSLDFIEMLIKEGASVNVRDIYDQTPLLKSIRGNPSITQLLLKHGASTEARDLYGNTPLSEAIFRNKTEQLKLLLEHGAKTNQLLELQPGRRAREGDVNILHFTAWYGDIEIMRALEGSEQHSCLSPRPIDDFEHHREFRQANGLGVEKEDHDAFVRLLSNVWYSHENSQFFNDSKDNESDEGESFTDAEEYP